MAKKYKIQHRYDTAANWQRVNPILLVGEYGEVSDSATGEYKVGDGRTPWNGLKTYHHFDGSGAAGSADGTFNAESTNAIQNGTVTKKFGEVDAALNKLLGDKVSLALSASPSLMFVGENKTVTLRATLSGASEVISISNGSSTWSSQGKVNTFSHSISVVGKLGVIASCTATATAYGITKTAYANVEGVNSMYFGSAYNYDEVVNVPNRQTARKTPHGTYSAEIMAGYKAVFAIPTEMTFDPSKLKDKVEGYGFPVSLVSTEGGYNYYESGVFKNTSSITLIYQ